MLKVSAPATSSSGSLRPSSAPSSSSPQEPPKAQQSAPTGSTVGQKPVVMPVAPVPGSPGLSGGKPAEIVVKPPTTQMKPADQQIQKTEPAVKPSSAVGSVGVPKPTSPAPPVPPAPPVRPQIPVPVPGGTSSATGLSSATATAPKIPTPPIAGKVAGSVSGASGVAGKIGAPSPALGPQPMVRPGSVISPLSTPAGSAPVTPSPVTPSLAPKPGVAPVKPVVQPETIGMMPAKGGPKPPAPPVGSALVPAAMPKKFPTLLVAIIGGVLALILLVVFLLRGSGGAPTSGPELSDDTESGSPVAQQPQNVTLTYWGLWESDAVMREIFSEFQKQNPGVTIEYVSNSPRDYRERLQTALQRGSGPDLFRFHASWVPMMRRELATLPRSVMTPEEYGQTFYQVAVDALTSNKNLVGIPHMYEGLGLFYNTDIFEKANVTPPKDWTELDQTAQKLTIRNGERIERAGAALGGTANVDNFSDIIALLILQNNGDPANLTIEQTSDAYVYYSNFAKRGIWDSTLPNSTYAFATEKVAMIIAPSWRAHEIKQINPNLKFAVAPVPQLAKERPVAFASFWAEGVSAASKNQEVAWKLLKFLSSKDMLQKFYQDAATKTPRSFGEIYPRADMGSLLAGDPFVGAFVSDAPKAKSWYMSSRTFDNGINDKIIKYVEDAINALVEGQPKGEVLGVAQQGINQVLQTYNVPTAVSTAPSVGGGAAAQP